MKYLFYAMKGEKMCFQHVLLNALALHQAGHSVKIVFEGESVRLPRILEEEMNPLYQKALQAELIAGVCKACSAMLGVLDYNQHLPYPMLADMNGHAGMEPFVKEDYLVITL